MYVIVICVEGKKIIFDNKMQKMYFIFKFHSNKTANIPFSTLEYQVHNLSIMTVYQPKIKIKRNTVI